MIVLDITKKADGLMTLLPQGKKKFAILGFAFVLLVAIVIAIAGNSPSDGPPVEAPTGSDLKDLAIARPPTGVTLRGTFTINNLIPLPCGFVVAYPESMTGAIASSPIQRDGSYKLDDVPPMPLVLVVKPKLTDEPNYEIPKHSRAMPGPPKVAVKQRGVAGQYQGRTRLQGEAKLRSLTSKQPSREALSRIKADVVTPEMDYFPEVQWLIEYAFFKYDGTNHEVQKILVPEGKKFFKMNLMVP